MSVHPVEMGDIGGGRVTGLGSVGARVAEFGSVGGVAVIDLGENPSFQYDEEPPRPWQRGTPLLALALALLLPVLLGGSAVPRYALQSLFSVPANVDSSYSMGSGSLYVSRGRTVTAYQVPAGTRGWSYQAPETVSDLTAVPAAGVVLVELRPANPAGVIALDTRTGRLLWRDDLARIVAVFGDSGRALLETVDLAATSHVYGVDVASGRMVWRRQTGTGVDWTMADQGDSSENAGRLVFFDSADDYTEVIDGVTGASLVRARLDIDDAAGSHSSDGSVTVGPDGRLQLARSIVGDQLFVARGDPDDTLLDAYDLTTLASQWHVKLPAHTYFVSGCGEILCVGGFNIMSAVDPHTGRELWHSQQWRWAVPLPGGRLLVSSAMAGAPDAIVDPVSLRPEASLSTWSPLGMLPAGPIFVAKDVDNLLTWFGVVDGTDARSARTGRHPTVRPLGSAWGVQRDECSLTDDGYLVCPTVRNELRLWRYQGNP